MTIITKPDLPGTKALAQRPSTPAATIVAVPTVLPATPSASAFGNLAIGRSGQLGIVDRLHLFGIADSGVSTVLYLRDADFDNDPSTGATSVLLELPIGAQAFNLTTNTRQWFNYSIDKFGYVLRSDDTRVDEGGSANDAKTGYRQFPRRLELGMISAAQPREMDGYAKMRYVDKDFAENFGVVRGAWGGQSTAVGSSFALLAAPGAGLHFRIRTLIIIGAGGATPAHRLTIGANATAANAPLMEVYSSPGEDGYAVKFFGTDLDIPTPENTPIYMAWDSGFNLRATVLIGCEVAPVANSNHLTLTGIPQ